MLTKDLKVLHVEISEFDYAYKGLFTLSDGNSSIRMELNELEDTTHMNEVKKLFSLEESVADIKKSLTGMVIDQSSLSSHISEGEDYQEDVLSSEANEMDMA